MWVRWKPAGSERVGPMTAGPAGSSLTDRLLDTLVAALADDPQRAVLATDFDGVLAPIVDHPEHARPHPDALVALARLGHVIGQLVVITGRPARTAVQLGGLDIEPGLRRLVVLGQYGEPPQSRLDVQAAQDR